MIEDALAAVPETTRALDALIESGILGALLVLAILGGVVLFYILVKVMEKRVTEAAKWQEIISANTQALRDFTEVERQRMLLRMHEAQTRQADPRTYWDLRTPPR